MSVARQEGGAPSDAPPTAALPLGDDERAGRAEAARTIGLVPAFDGLRGIFVIIACMYHMQLFIPWWATFVPGSFVGVDLFFVLSGFLITAILLREYDRTKRIRLTPFYQGRVLRLFPALFAMVAAEFIWSMFRHYPLDYEFKAVVSALTYSSNWGLHLPWSINFFEAARYDVGMVQLWSLAVEEQFYLLWPLVLIGLLAITRRFKWMAITVVVLGLVLVTVHRILAYYGTSYHEFHDLLGWSVFYKRTDYRADDLLWGVLLAFVWVRGWFPRRGLKVAGWIGAVILVGSIFVAAQWDGWVYVWGLPVIAIGALVVVLAVVETDWKAKRILETRWLCAVGMVSYGMYVWHVLCYQIVLNAVPHWPAGYQMLAAASLVALATVGSWFLVEKPFLRVKDRLRKRQGGLATREAPPVYADPAAAAGSPAGSGGRPDGVAPELAPEIARLFDAAPPAE